MSYNDVCLRHTKYTEIAKKYYKRCTIEHTFHRFYKLAQTELRLAGADHNTADKILQAVFCKPIVVWKKCQFCNDAEPQVCFRSCRHYALCRKCAVAMGANGYIRTVCPVPGCLATGEIMFPNPRNYRPEKIIRGDMPPPELKSSTLLSESASKKPALEPFCEMVIPIRPLSRFVYDNNGSDGDDDDEDEDDSRDSFSDNSVKVSA